MTVYMPIFDEVWFKNFTQQVDLQQLLPVRVLPCMKEMFHSQYPFSSTLLGADTLACDGTARAA